MTSVWIDPGELQETADLLRSVAAQVAGLSNDLIATCCCAGPGTLAAYLAEELGAIQSGGRDASTQYASSAIDLATRAGVITDDQSLATAGAAAYGTEPAAFDPTNVAIGGGGVPEGLAGLTGSGPQTQVTIGGGASDGLAGLTGTAPQTVTIGGDIDPSFAGLFEPRTPDLVPVSTWATPVGVGTTAGTSYLSEPGILNAMTDSYLAPAGLTRADTSAGWVYVDGAGNSAATLTNASVDPDGTHHFSG